MPIQKQTAPRDNQKARTRHALVAAATQLMRSGAPPTVADAAELAKVSRATAYRYFPTQDSLLVEISQVTPVAAPVEDWVASRPPGEPAEHLRELVNRFNRVSLQEEAALRTGLRMYLDMWLQARGKPDTPSAVREGRRMRWLDEVLAPVRKQLKPARWKRLRAALALTLGVEAMVVMKDVCHCTDAEALASLEWAALALLRSALEDAGRASP
ncbi:MAG: TetR/AcrR family transcriptional regulator [Ramlibacter sp.]